VADARYLAAIRLEEIRTLEAGAVLHNLPMTDISLQHE